MIYRLREARMALIKSPFGISSILFQRRFVSHYHTKLLFLKLKTFASFERLYLTDCIDVLQVFLDFKVSFHSLQKCWPYDTMPQFRSPESFYFILVNTMTNKLAAGGSIGLGSIACKNSNISLYYGVQHMLSIMGWIVCGMYLNTLSTGIEPRSELIELIR